MADEGLGDEVERAIDELYAADPVGFTAARARLAGDLRRAGRRDDATRVAGLRRPTLAAWAVDHLALRAPERIDALVAAGERLRRAQEEAVSGGDPRLLHRAGEERRALIAALAMEALDAVRARGGDAWLTGRRSKRPWRRPLRTRRWRPSPGGAGWSRRCRARRASPACSTCRWARPQPGRGRRPLRGPRADTDSDPMTTWSRRGRR